MKNTFNIDLNGEKVCLRMNEDLYLMKNSWDCLRHNHSNYELHIVLCGQCTMNIGHRKRILQHHQALIVTPGQYHYPMFLSGDFERFSMSFSLSDGWLLRSAQKKIQTDIIFSVTDEIISLCREIFHESAAANPLRHEMLQILLTKLMICGIRVLRLAENVNREFLPISDSERIDMIDAFFETHLADDLGAVDLAAELHMSRRQLNRVLQHNYGMGFREKLLQARMDQAMWLLRSTDKRICDIAGEVGYNSEAAFYQVFRAKMGITPAQYRLGKNPNSQ